MQEKDIVLTQSWWIRVILIVLHTEIMEALKPYIVIDRDQSGEPAYGP